MLFVTGLAFMFADREPTIRQLYSIAELSKRDDEPTLSPEFMQLTVQSTYVPSPDPEIDFRDEILHQIYDPGDSVPKRKLTFAIEVTDEGTLRGLLTKRRTFKNWQGIGRIEFTEAVASYNTDFVLHFPHPPWRTDRNDVRTQHRKA